MLSRTFSAASMVIASWAAVGLIGAIAADNRPTRAVGLFFFAAMCLCYAVRKRRQLPEIRRAKCFCEKCGFDLHESVTCCGECGHPLPIGHRPRSAILKSLEEM